MQDNTATEHAGGMIRPSDETDFIKTIMGPVILHPSVDEAAVDEAPEIIEHTEVIAFPFLSWQ